MAEAIGEPDAALLLDMLIAAQDARDFVQSLTEADFTASRLHQNAVIRALEVIGEAASKVSNDFKAANTAIAWRNIIGMRNRLIHGYAEISLGMVWNVTQESIPTLMTILESLIPSKPPEPY